MSDPIITAEQLGTYLGDPNIDTDRATLIIGLAQSLCESIVSPLPVGSEAVVYEVAARGYTNPANIQQQSVGPFSINNGSMSGGLWLTSANEKTLRRLAGGGGAFMIDTMPADAGQGLPWWDTGIIPGIPL